MASVPDQMDVSKITVRKTTKRDISLVGDLLVDGFHDSPFWACIDLHTEHPDAEKYFFDMRAYFLLNDSHLILYDGEIIGHYALSSSTDQTPPSFWTILRSGWWFLPLRFGRAFANKLTEMVSTIDDIAEPVVAPREPFHMLEAFTIHSAWRGRGVGRHVVEQLVLRECARVVLTAVEPRNVHFYERLGFQMLAHREQHVADLSGRDRQYQVWIMERDQP